MRLVSGRGAIVLLMSSKLSPEQVEEFKQAFKLFDANGDGQISPNELRAIMKQFGYETSEEDIMSMINNIDKDKNGAIELEEFLNFIESQAAQPQDERAELLKAFKMFDKDGNGLITKQELLEGLNKLGETMNEKDALELIEAADLDGDGNINFEEFVELMRQQ